MKSTNNSKKGTKNCLNNLIGIREKKDFLSGRYIFRDLIIQIALRGFASHRSNKFYLFNINLNCGNIYSLAIATHMYIFLKFYLCEFDSIIYLWFFSIKKPY